MPHQGKPWSAFPELMCVLASQQTAQRVAGTQGGSRLPFAASETTVCRASGVFCSRLPSSFTLSLQSSFQVVAGGQCVLQMATTNAPAQLTEQQLAKAAAAASQGDVSARFITVEVGQQRALASPDGRGGSSGAFISQSALHTAQTLPMAPLQRVQAAIRPPAGCPEPALGAGCTASHPSALQPW